jgi:hypothetical protein
VPGAVVVFCGKSWGQVSVTVELSDGPGTGDFSDWDEVSDVDLRPVEGSARVAALFEEPPTELVDLTPPGHEGWRVRVLSRGRDASTDGSDEVLEHHRFVMWPSDTPAELVIHRQTDAFGAARRSETSDWSVEAEPTPPLRPDRPQRAPSGRGLGLDSTQARRRPPR